MLIYFELIKKKNIYIYIYIYIYSGELLNIISGQRTVEYL